MDRPKRILRLNRSTIRHLDAPELRTARGGDEVEPVTRAFTDCEYCGYTNAPGPCASDGCPVGDSKMLIICRNCLPNDPRCETHEPGC